MKYLITIVFLGLVLSCGKTSSEKELEKTILKEEFTFVKSIAIPSAIDSLSNEPEVENFIKSNDSTLLNFRLVKIQDFNRDNRFPIDSITKRMADSLHVDKSFYKGDFDNNGYTDLVFIGDNHYCSKPAEEHCDFNCRIVMGFKNDSISIHRLNYRMKSFVPQVINKEGESLLILHEQGDFYWRERKFRTNNTSRRLAYRFGKIIEHNPNPKDYNIEEVYIETSPCFGSCPSFFLKFDNHGEAYFRAKEYNFFKEYTEHITLEEYNAINEKEEGVYKSKIKTEDVKELITILKYLDFPNLEESYAVPWTDSQYVSLVITYDGGKRKLISDYGKLGTYGLKFLYEKLFELRFNQDWNEITPKDKTKRNIFRDSIFQNEFDFIKQK